MYQYLKQIYDEKLQSESMLILTLSYNVKQTQIETSQSISQGTEHFPCK